MWHSWSTREGGRKDKGKSGSQQGAAVEEVGHLAEGKSLKCILIVLGNHGAFKPKDIVGFGSKALVQKGHG